MVTARPLLKCKEAPPGCFVNLSVSVFTLTNSPILAGRLGLQVVQGVVLVCVCVCLSM